MISTQRCESFHVWCDREREKPSSATENCCSAVSKHRARLSVWGSTASSEPSRLMEAYPPQLEKTEDAAAFANSSQKLQELRGRSQLKMKYRIYELLLTISLKN